MTLERTTWGGDWKWGGEQTAQAHFIQSGTKNGACTPDRSRKLSIEIRVLWRRSAVQADRSPVIGECSKSETRLVAEHSTSTMRSFSGPSPYLTKLMIYPFNSIAGSSRGSVKKRKKCVNWDVKVHDGVLQR